MRIRASVIGASGYTGIELIRLLQAHPKVELKYLISETYQGQAVKEVYPHLAKLVSEDFSPLALAELAEYSDVVFLALPATHAAGLIPTLLAAECKVIDLSADLRLKDPQQYQEWYQHPPVAADILQQAVYGLPEIGYRKRIASAQLIANPGCYPTATLLALAPLINAGLLDLSAGPLVIDAKSGVSGAGRGLSLGNHFCEVMNNFSAYQVGGIHRHIPEIEQELKLLARQELQIQFTPHLIPTPRGILVTVYGRLKSVQSLASIERVYRDYYGHSFFVRISSALSLPGIKAVIGSNFCDLSLYVDPRTNYVVVVSTIDNLLKGAAGQAIQNMNLMCHHPEATGLRAAPYYP